MDWTGGARKRFGAAKGNSMQQKQKAHFAKARAALQATPISKSFQPASFAADTTVHSPGAGLPTQHGPVAAERTNNELRQQRDWERIASRPNPDCRDRLTVEPLNEDAMLIANRKRLLARQDWLNLDASRPLRLQFPSQGDKDWVGKRRRINKASSQRAKPARQRALTPLFQQKLPQVTPLGHRGSPYNDQIRIRIGTEALASQTHRSQSLHTRESRQFSPISEESMLLDADDEVPLSAPGRPKQVRLPGSVDVFAGSQMTRPIGTTIPQLSSRQRSVSPGGSPGYFAQQQPSSSLRQNLPSAASSSSCRDKKLFSDAYQHIESGRLLSEDGARSMPQSKSARSATSCTPVHNKSSAKTHDETASEEDDEATWRALMHIKPLFTSGDSLAVLRSSSQHLTASESSHRPRLADNKDCHGQCEVPSVSTPRGAGTQAAFNHIEPERTSMQLHASPSESLKQIRALTDMPQPVPTTDDQPSTGQHRDYDDDDALWRHFIVGSQDTSSQGGSEPEGESTAANNPTVSEDTDMLVSLAVEAAHTSSSNGATAGETLFVTGNTSPVEHLLKKQQREHSGSGCGNGLRQPLANPYDSKDKSEESLAARPTNIHALRTNRLPANLGGISRRKAIAKSREVGPAKVERSVYDLLDNDGGLPI